MTEAVDFPAVVRRIHSQAGSIALGAVAFMSSTQVVVYSRRGCHLCDEAHSLLVRHGLEPEVVDIDEHPELRERYDACVPVVTFDGKERFRGRVNEVLLRRLLRRS